MNRSDWKRSCLQVLFAAVGVSVLSSGDAERLIAPNVVGAAEDLAKSAATVEEVTKVLDLRTLPLPEGASMDSPRQLGMLNYEVKGDLKSAFAYQQQQLAKLGWKELAGTQTEATYCTGLFQKSGFVVSVTSYEGGGPEKKGMSRVSLTNHGNVRLAKLPVVKGAKTLFANESTAAYSVAMKPAEAVEATRKLFLDAGWEPFGSQAVPPDGAVMSFKQNAIHLTAFAGAPQPGKEGASVNYSSSVLSADIPAPPNAENLSYADHTKTLQFETPADYDAVAKFYQQRLAKLGWKPTAEQLTKQQDKFRRPVGLQVFRNAAKDILTLDLEPSDDKTRAKLTHLTAVEAAAIEKREKEAAQRFVAKQKAEEEADKVAQNTKPKTPPKSDLESEIEKAANDAIAEALKGVPSKKGAATGKDKDAVSVPIPEGAKKVTQTSGNVLQIKFAANKGQTAAEALRDQLLAAGWEADDDDKIEKNSGNVTFTKDGKTLTMSYVDTGFTDVNMMLIGIGVKLTEGKVDPDAKVTAKPEKKSDKPDTKPTKPTAKKKKPKSDDDGDTPVAAPARPEKAKRGIAKLEKLPNEVKLIADGKPVSLPHVIAYDIVSDGRWVTRILATDTPIKQASLIELLKKNGADDELRSRSPRLLVELDDQDKPIGMSYAGNGSLGSASESGMIGEAIVEEGRARGTFKAKKESEFFGKKIIGEITFDVPVLTRDSQPTKQLANAKKLETSGNLVINNKTMKLGHFAAYQIKWLDNEIRTAIRFSEKPIDMGKLKAALAKDGTDDGLFDFSSHVKVVIDKNDSPAFLNLYTDGASVSQNTNLVGDVIVEDGRARGTVKLDKAIDFAGKNINFDLTFDLDVLMLPAKDKE